MTAVSTVALHPAPGVGEQRATRIAFFIAGFAGSTWAALVPFAKAHARIGNGGLGLLLLCLGIGSIATMPVSGALTARFGCRPVISIAALVLVVTLPLLATVSVVPLLVFTLMVFGAGIGTIDVAMNVQAIIVERGSGRAMMSGFHGLFSVGGIAGAGGMAVLFAAGASPLIASACVSVGIVGALAIAVSHLLPYGGRSGGPAFAIPRGIVLVISLMCFVLFLAEGAILDWSAIFLTSVRHVLASYAGLGYAAFAAAMTIGRLTGDRIVHWLGRERVVLVGGLCAAFGFIVTIVLPFWSGAILGFALIGIGCSNIVPVLFTCVGRQSVMPEGLAMSAISTIGYTGVLAGPAAIGFIAQLTSLPSAFLIVAIMLVAVALCSRQLRRVV